MAFPVSILAVPRAVRLVATARLRDPVLLGLVSPSMLDDLAEIEGATSARLRDERFAATSYPSHRPHAAFVNAAFSYFRPREMNRFNGPERGAWYAAFAVETAIAEVSYHMQRELDRVQELPRRGGLRGNLGKFRRRIRRSARTATVDPLVSILIRLSATRPAMRWRRRRWRWGTTGSSTHRFGTMEAPASLHYGRTPCSPWRRAAFGA